MMRSSVVATEFLPQRLVKTANEARGLTKPAWFATAQPQPNIAAAKVYVPHPRQTGQGLFPRPPASAAASVKENNIEKSAKRTGACVVSVNFRPCRSLL